MEEAERVQRKPDPLSVQYLCLSEDELSDWSKEEDELSDWSEEDLSLHFSASVLESSESESEPGPGLDPGPGPDKSVPQTQTQRPEPYLDLPENKPRPQQQQQQPRPQLCFQRQHSLPESGGGAYKGLIAGLPSAGHSAPQPQRKLQKSLSLDESRTKMASCLIKTVLSKRMQEEEEQQGAPKPSHTQTRTETQAQSQTQTRSKPSVQNSLSSKPPSRAHIKLAASLSQSQRKAESGRPITAQNPPDHGDSNLSEQICTEAPPPLPPEKSSSLGLRRETEEPLRVCSRGALPHFASAQDQPPPRGHNQTTVDPLRPTHPSVLTKDQSPPLGHARPVAPHRFSSSRRLHTKASGQTPRHSPSSLSTVDLAWTSHPSALTQDQASSLGPADLTPPGSSSTDAPHAFAESLPSAQDQPSPQGRHLQTLPPPWSSKDPPCCSGTAQERRASLGQRRVVVAPPWFSSSSAQDEAFSVGHPRPPLPWLSSAELHTPRTSRSAQDKASSLGRVHPVAPWSSSSEQHQGPRSPRCSLPAQDEASSLGRVHSVAPWSSSSVVQAPRSSLPAQDEASFLGCVRPPLPSLSSLSSLSSLPSLPSLPPSLPWEEKAPLQRKALLDPETGQFVQVFVPVPSPAAPVLQSPAPMVFPGNAPAVLSLGYGPGILSGPTVLVPVQSSVFTQPCLILPPIQPWVYYRHT